MKTRILILLLAAMLLFSACGKTAAPAETAKETEPAAAETPPSETSPPETPPPETDLTGAYYLNAAGEAILDDAYFSSAAAAEDNYRVFYEIFVGSFSDSDGDGTGDLRGVINRMDYLNDGDPHSGCSLGVEGIWLTPVFPSGSYHKYDVNNYYGIDPAFGTLDDLKELVALCHERGVKLILDLPINHTGPLCEWFGSFRRAHREGDTASPYYDFYCWYGPGDDAPAGRHFAPISGTQDYYECNFSGDMPELNFDNPAVRETVLDVAKFWMDLGVDGFRFDAAKYVYLGENQRSAEFWQWYAGELRKLNPEVYLVGEVWDSDGITDIYYSAMNCFDFTTSQTEGLISATAKKGNVNAYTSYVDKYLDTVRAINPDAMIVPFIANHDTDRAAGYLTVTSGHMQMAANLYLLSSGSPFIYYGEELGMRGSRGGASTDANRRLAMVWGDGDTVKDPVGTDYPASKQVEETVADQRADGGSLLSYYKKLIAIRQANPEIARGDYTALPFTDTRLGGFTASWNGNTVCVLHNTTGSAAEIDLSTVTDLEFRTIAAVIGMEDAELNGTTVRLGSQTSVVLR